MGPHGHEGMMQGGQSMWMAPIMGGIFAVMLFLAAFTAWQLWRRREQLGAMVRSQLGGARQTPEFKAREILAERFARGEISSEEFMERSSMLNWTPGVEPKPASKR